MPLGDGLPRPYVRLLIDGEFVVAPLDTGADGTVLTERQARLTENDTESR